MTEQVSDQSYFNIILFMVYPFLGKYLKSFSKQHKDIHKELNHSGQKQFMLFAISTNHDIFQYFNI